jgi:hypothetical protein
MKNSVDLALRDTIRSIPAPILLAAEPALLLQWDNVGDLARGVIENSSRDRLACYFALYEMRTDSMNGPVFSGLLEDLGLGHERSSLLATALWAGDWRNIEHAGAELKQLRENYLSLGFDVSNVERLLTSGRLDPVMSADELVRATGSLEEFENLEEVHGLHETALSAAFQKALHVVQKRECDWLIAGRAAGLTRSERAVLKKRSRGRARQKDFKAEYAAHWRKKSRLKKAVEENLKRREVIAGPMSDASITFFLERLESGRGVYQHKSPFFDSDHVAPLPQPISPSKQAKLLEQERRRRESEPSRSLDERFVFQIREAFDIAWACGLTGKLFQDVCQ